MTSFHANRLRFLAACVSTALLVLVLPACKKEGGTEVKLPPGLIAFEAQIDAANAQLQKTVAALTSVIAATGDTAQTKLKEFNTSLDELDTQATATKKMADELRAKGKDYFAEWEKKLGEIATPAIKEAAEKRRGELTASYEAVEQSMKATADAFNPLLADLKDMRKILENDLSPAGRETLTESATKLKTAAGALQKSIDTVKTNLEKIAAIYSAK